MCSCVNRYRNEFLNIGKILGIDVLGCNSGEECFGKYGWFGKKEYFILIFFIVLSGYMIFIFCLVC